MDFQDVRAGQTVEIVKSVDGAMSWKKWENGELVGFSVADVDKAGIVWAPTVADLITARDNIGAVPIVTLLTDVTVRIGIGWHGMGASLFLNGVLVGVVDGVTAIRFV